MVVIAICALLKVLFTPEANLLMRLAHYQGVAKLASAWIFAVGLGSNAKSTAESQCPSLLLCSLGDRKRGLGWRELLMLAEWRCPQLGLL